MKKQKTLYPQKPQPEAKMSIEMIKLMIMLIIAFEIFIMAIFQNVPLA